ncbi:MAG: ATP-dependent Clp protease ATP-binding subunit [Prevotellaceae bacterium]|nr:ATP-dependent Clp protease ATP-binding subunit [Prevotellaceae bacterium]
MASAGYNGASILEAVDNDLGGADTNAVREFSPQSAGEASIPLNEECARIMKLTMLEARLNASDMADTGHLLLGMLHDRDNGARRALHRRNVTYECLAGQLKPQSGFQPKAAFDYAQQDADDDRPGPGSTQRQQTGGGRQESDTPVIDNFGTDLTRVAVQGGLDPIVGREQEILRIAQILSRRKKNNPILIGGPGVGKSAVVEGLARLIAERKVPRFLLHKRIVALDMASIVAGTQYRGQFEERLRRLIQELREHREIILFIDEIHTIIGAGSAPGGLDAANILKPALARGEVQCIGATTIDEYRKTIEKDGALERRFQKILLEQPSAEDTLHILANIKDRYEEHHHVFFSDDALEACVRLTEKYVSDRALPDKAIDALDEAGARARLSSIGAPKEIEELEEKVRIMQQEKSAAVRSQDFVRAANLRDDIQEIIAEIEARTKVWKEQEKENRPIVTEEDVAEVVSMMSGVPARRLTEDENARIKTLREKLGARVIAQEESIRKLVRAIQRNRLGLKGNDRPVGTFMFVGPTGVGKTHLVKCLAEEMFGRKDALIRIDMSEYGEKYSTSRLVGAPPGYVGYDEGGQLTEKVRRHPYSVVLLDEIEKAHPDVFNMLLQVMDEGRMTDGNGTTVDFRNTIIIMTSNSGSRQLKEFGTGIGFGATSGSTPAQAEGIVRKALSKQFAPEFLNRLDDIIMFSPLNEEAAKKIASLEIGALAGRLEANGVRLHVSDEAVNWIVAKGFDRQYGARSLKRAIQTHIEDAVCEQLLENRETAAVIEIGCRDTHLQIELK